MSKYNSYAVELDKAFKKAFKEYSTLVERVNRAKADYERTTHNFKETYAGEQAVSQAVAKAILLDAETALRVNGEGIWVDFFAKRGEIGGRLAEAVRKDNAASPDGVDNNALELLKSDILSAEEMAILAEKYDGNPTMLRLIAKYAGDKAMNANSGLSTRERGMLITVADACKNGGGAVMQAWESLVRGSNYCSGGGYEGIKGSRGRDAGHALAMGAKWEELYAGAIEKF